jgi:hypothetical protein
MIRSALLAICGAMAMAGATGASAKGPVDPIDAAMPAAMAETGARGLALATIEHDTTIHDLARWEAAVAQGYGLPARSRSAYAKGTLPITTSQQFPTLLLDAPEPQRPNAKAALGVIAFTGPQGPGWFKGGHNDTTANTLVCLERAKRCVLILSNDVRAERSFRAQVRAALGETGVPYRWEYLGLPKY